MSAGVLGSEPLGRFRPSGATARFLRDPLGAASAVVLLVLVAATLLAPLLTPLDPNLTDLAHVLEGPSDAHLLGTDSAGRDVWSRLLHGGRSTFLAAAVALSTAAVIGIPSGLLAGYARGRIDGALSWVASVFLAAPTMVILLAARAALGTSMVLTMTVLGVLLSPSFFRLVRGVVHTVRDALYVDAARVVGLGDIAIVWRHILVAVRSAVIIQTVEIAGVAIGVQAGLEFLGLGDQRTPNWGLMLNEGFRNVYVSPLLLVWPAAAIALTVVSLALFGNALRDALEPGQARRGAGRRRRDASGPGAALLGGADDGAASVRHDGDEPVVVRGLTIAYPHQDEGAVVHGVDLSVGRGEIVGLVGESGSGKTQIALSILGLLPPQAELRAGSVRVDGRDLVDRARGHIIEKAARSVRGRLVGYVPQEPMVNLDPNARIGAQLALPLRQTLGLSRSQARRRALALLRSVGLADAEKVAASYPWQISGGMAQRVLIAAAIGAEPQIVVADEPTSALDVSVQAEILDLLSDLRDEQGVGMLVVTHDFGVVADLCDRVVVLERGVIVEEGPTRDVLAAPVHPYTRSLLAAHLSGREPAAIDRSAVSEGARG